MDIGRPQRIIIVEPEPAEAPDHFEPMPQEPVRREEREPVPVGPTPDAA